MSRILALGLLGLAAPRLQPIPVEDGVTLMARTEGGAGGKVLRVTTLASTAGEILMFVEDVGRHNAVDAIAGFMWLEGIDGSDKVFYTTGRLTSEMVIKCAQMRIPFLVSRSGLTQMGYEIARKVGITMLGHTTPAVMRIRTALEQAGHEPALWRWPFREK